MILLLALFGVVFFLPVSKFDYGKENPAPADSLATRTCEYFRYPGNTGGMTLCDGVAHSLYIAALQRPEPKAADTLTKFFVILETILGPLQAALLALAIRRKFMK